MTKQKNGIVIVCSIFVLIAIFIIVSVKYYNGGIHINRTKYDENNIGELYYFSIDPDHIAEDENGIMYVDNEILVVAAEGVPKSKMEQLTKKYDAEIVGYIEQTGDYQWKFEGAKSKDEFNDLIAELNDSKIISDVYLNYVSEIEEDTIPDSENIVYGSQWSADLVNSTDIEGLSWGVEAINAPATWDYLNLHKADINPIKVGLIDYGFDETNEDLTFAEIFYDNDENSADVSYDYPGDFHGMHVAGTMAANGTNNEGINGVYPYGAGRLYAVSYVGTKQYEENNRVDDGKTNFSSLFLWKIDLAELILRNVKVINISVGISPYEISTARLTVADHLGDYLDKLLDMDYDFVIVNAAGNDYGKDSRYNSWFSMIDDSHKSYNHIIVVGSIGNGSFERDEEGVTVNLESGTPIFHFENKYEISDFSNTGERVDIFAPGCYIYSTVPDAVYSQRSIIGLYTPEEIGNENFYQNWYRYLYKDTDLSENRINYTEGDTLHPKVKDRSGTSMAAPHVAGVCANVWSINNDLTGEQVKEIVVNSIVVHPDCPQKDNVTDDNYFDILFDEGYKGIYKYPVVDCCEAVRTAWTTKGLSENDDKSLGAVLGWVVEQKADGSAADNSNGKVPNATISVYTNNSDHTLITETTTDEFGHYEVFLEAGDYLIEASCDGYSAKNAKDSVAVKVRSQEVTYAKWIELFPENTYDSDDSSGDLSDENGKNDNFAQDQNDDNIVYLEDMPIISVERYDGDRGENFIEKIGTNAVSRGNIDINGNSYIHGLEGWIGRWNYTDVQGWVETTFELDDSYQSLSGRCVLIQSYNVTNFDTTLYFYGDNKLIKSYHMTPDTFPFDISVDVTGVKKLKLAIYDNIAVPGGTSFGFIDMILSSKSPVSESNDAEIFTKLPESFTFSSGAGGWSTDIKINYDGTFTGYYSDSNLGETDVNYPNGTVYICDFNGKFTNVKKIDEYTYSMNLDFIKTQGTKDEIYYEDGVRYIYADPYGFDDADEFMIYLPGSNMDDLPEGFKSWSHISTDIGKTIPIGVYGIYNVGGQQGFVGMDENSFWKKTYEYTYGKTRSNLRPSYYSTNHITFWPDNNSAASIILSFTWEEDKQTTFVATDSRGSGDYTILLKFNDDNTKVTIEIVSIYGYDLSMYGGTIDGKLSAEYFLSNS